MTEASAFIGLFLSAFLAATLIPAQSEVGLGYLVINTDYSMVLLVTVASLAIQRGQQSIGSLAEELRDQS